MHKKKIGIILFLMIVIIIITTIIFLYVKLRENQENSNDLEDSAALDIGIISYEGTFKSKGVVVRPEKNTLTIMPTEAGEKYRATEFFYYETENTLNLKQKQEVLVTFHYRKDPNDLFEYDAIIDDVEILKEESNIEIPRDIFVKAYSSKDNILISINKEKSNNKGIQFTITDKNELKYNYSTMKYNLQKYNSPSTKTEIIHTEDGGTALPGYDPYPEIPKIKDSSNEFNYAIDENGQVDININWSDVYGELEEGEYRFSLSTVLQSRVSILNEHIIDYPYDGVIINMKFNINSNGEMTIDDNNVEIM